MCESCDQEWATSTELGVQKGIWCGGFDIEVLAVTWGGWGDGDCPGACAKGVAGGLRQRNAKTENVLIE